MPIPTTPIEWTEEYAVHIPLIDDQHRTLFDMIEQLRLAALRSDDRGEVGSVLKGLITYCVEHFDSEELVMQDIGYPVYKSHAAVHQQFTDRCIEWVNAYAEGQLEVEYVVDYLTHWLVNHILHSDKKIEAFCNEHNIDASCITSIADVLPPEENPKDLSRGPSLTHRLAIPLTVAFILSSVAVFIALASPDWGWELNRSIAAACALQGTTFPLFFALIYHIRHYLANHERVAKAMHARQLADNLLAGEIASRIAVMDLDSMAELFQGNTNSSLVMQLQCIVSNLQLFRPYIPNTLFVQLQPKEEDEAIPPITVERPVDPTAIPGLASNKPISETDSPLHPKRHRNSDFSELHANPAEIPKLWARRALSGSGSSRSRTMRASAAHTRLALVRGTKRRVVTCLATDIAGFHSVVQNSDADELLVLHSWYLSLVKESTERVKGVLHGVSGDRVLCTWNASTPVANHSVLACQAALAIQRGSTVLPDGSQNRMRLMIGVASGSARVGNMGCERKIDFTLLSPVVPLSFALAKLNLQLNTGGILIDASCWGNCAAHFHAECVAAVEPVGDWPSSSSTGQEPNGHLVYELKGNRMSDENEETEWMYRLERSVREDPLSIYNAGVVAYYAGRWDECLRLLRQFKERNPTHGRVTQYINHCQLITGTPQNITSSTRILQAPVHRFGWHIPPPSADGQNHSIRIRTDSSIFSRLEDMVPR
eukprot:TRINITY_DN836_c0_g1_i2.p1 TRINITY_DN836_c0_g1~~TRINITY_DN836_c0_g1_i2.p1  ORF type:complete len:712 (-),score=85.50 TRINITY_DN836_c0_g1_i2:367-2502(-)